MVDLKSGHTRRLLVEDASTLVDKNVDLTINGKEVETAEKQKPKFNVDGIALSPDNEYLYYQSILSGKLYRVATAKLLDENLSKGDLSKAVETVGLSFPVDGLWMAKDGYLYLSDLRTGAIQRRKVPDGENGDGRRRSAHPVAGFLRAGPGRRNLLLLLAHSPFAAVQRRQKRAHGALHDL